MNYRVHFSQLGWTEFRNTNDVLWFDGLQMESLEVKCDSGIHVSLEAINSKGDELFSDDVVGVTKQSIGLKAIAIRTDSEDSIFMYRVYLKNIGWTKFAMDGELCGCIDMSSDTKSIVIEGVQIACVSKEILNNRELITKQADEKLKEYEVSKKNIYVRNKSKMLEVMTRDYIQNDISFREIENGIILPLHKINKSRNGVFEGGVTDKEGRFVAGHKRKTGKEMNLSCLRVYIPEEVEYCDEEVIYGGILIGFFGHTLTECTSRLWWILENSTNTDKIVFLKAPNTGNMNLSFIRMAGIPLERVEFIEKPTKFKKVIVPDQSILLWESICPQKFLVTYDSIRKNIEPSEYKKIYLTRTHLKKQDGINEEFFEDIYENLGFKIIALEEYPLEQQISYLKGAEEVVCTAGTLSHMTLFCNDGIKLTIINRTTNHILVPQILIDKAKRFEVQYIDATFNFLPTAHVCGPSLYGPTDLFIKYAKKNAIIDSEKINFDISKYIYDYVVKWMKTYEIEKNFNEISGTDMTQMLTSMHMALEDYNSYKKCKSKLQNRINELVEENKKLKEILDDTKKGVC